MYLITFLYILSCVLYVSIGISAIDSDSSNKQNRVFLMLCIVLAAWACSLAMMNLSSDAAAAGFFRLLSIAPCVIYPGLWMIFTLIFVEREDILKRKWIVVLIMLPVAISLYLYLLVPKTEPVMLRTIWGWTYVSGSEKRDLIREMFYRGFYTTYIILAIAFLNLWGRKTAVKRKKRQAYIINATVAAAFLIAINTDVVIPMMGIRNLPPMTVIIIQIPMVGILVSMKKYGLMKMSAENIASNVFRSMNNGMIVTDKNGKILHANNRAIKMLECQKENMSGLSIMDFIFQSAPRKAIEEVSGIETELLSKSGAICPVLLSVTAQNDCFNEIIGYVFIFQDIYDMILMKKELQKSNELLEYRVEKRTAQLTASNSKLKNAIEQIKESEMRIAKTAYLDMLTGLNNRNWFYMELKHCVSNKTNSFSVLIFDLDKFKRVNDTIGYSLGDQIIIEVGKRLQSLLSNENSVSRIGGDSYAVLLNRSLSTETDDDFAKKACEIISIPIQVNDSAITITTSVGCACFPMDSTDENQIIRYAEAALYKAKAEGGNKAVVFNSQFKKQIEMELRLSRDLYSAMKNSELELYYQPQIDSRTERIVGFEALIRWNHPTMGMISPEVMIGIAEKTGMIVPLGEWIITTACKQAKGWIDKWSTKFEMAINLSVAQFQDSNLIKKIDRVIKEVGLSADVVILEITESVAMEEIEKVVYKLEKLRELGLGIAIDDFGSGYSSLSYIAHLPIKQIKIDKTFIDNIGKNQKTELIIGDIVNLAKELNLRVIAEGCETIEQKEFLCSISCTTIQGYYYYKPMKAGDIEKLMEQEQARNKSTEVFETDVECTAIVKP